jgi:hypothetical protein
MNELKDSISIFKNFQSEPKTISLMQWLHSCKHGCRYSKQVLRYRETKQDSLKKSLPLVTVGAVCEGGRKMKHVSHRTGWIALDIDGKDNPHLSNAKHLRDEVANIRNVAFSGLSVSGNGVWALIKIENPDQQAEYFHEIQQDFLELFGIKLDNSKGRNPNDARFYSYDPDAIIKESFIPYRKLSKELPNSPVYLNELDDSRNYHKDFCGNGTRYGVAALQSELKLLEQTSDGNRNNQLFKSSAQLASLVASNCLNEFEVRNLLEQSARFIGLTDKEIHQTVESGFKKGLQNPRILKESYDSSFHNTAISLKEKPQVNSTPYEMNPWTGEVFDDRGYPKDWDNLLPS